jgi:hypothetical protein
MVWGKVMEARANLCTHSMNQDSSHLLRVLNELEENLDDLHSVHEEHVNLKIL